MDLTSRPVHPDHYLGIREALARALDLRERKDFVQKFLSVLVAPGATYAQLSTASERAITRAIYRAMDAEGVNIPETSIEYVVEFFPLMKPEVQRCLQCGALDFDLKAGRWVRVNRPDCVQCGAGVYGPVQFEQGVRAWTTRTNLQPGEQFDSERFPVTDSGLENLLSARGTRVDPTWRSLSREVEPPLLLTEWAEFLAHGRGSGDLSPTAVLKVLGDYTLVAVDRVGLEVLVRLADTYRKKVPNLQVREPLPAPSKVLNLVPPTPASPNLSGGTEVMEPRLFNARFRRTLTRYYGGAAVWILMEDAGGSRGSIAGDTDENRWGEILRQFQGTPSYAKLLDLACQEYPHAFRELVPLHLDLYKLKQQFQSLSAAARVEAARKTGVPDFFLARVADDWTSFDWMVQNGYSVALSKAMAV